MIAALLIITGLIGAFQAYRKYFALVNFPTVSPAINDRMLEINQLISIEAFAFLRREFQLLLIFIGIIFLLLFMFFGFTSGFTFVLGSGCTVLLSYLTAKIGTRTNITICKSAQDLDSVSTSLNVFNIGGLIGIASASLAILGLGMLFVFYSNFETSTALVGFALGSSFTTFFTRIGGSLFAKAAGIGADTNSMIDLGFSKDDPRNAGSLVDNIGDHVGSVSGFCTDIFDSYLCSIISCMLIALAMNFSGETSKQFIYMITPLVMAVIGFGASLIAIWLIKNQKDEGTKSILPRSDLLANAIFLAFMFVYMVYQAWVNDTLGLWHWLAIVIGSLSTIAFATVTDYIFSDRQTNFLIQASKAGSVTNIISGLAIGFMSCAPHIAIITILIALASWCGDSADNIYCISLAAVAMLSKLTITTCLGSFALITNNSLGLLRISGSGLEEGLIIEKLKSSIASQAASIKSIALVSATLTAYSLFLACFQFIYSRIELLNLSAIDLSIMNPQIVTGALVGISLTCIIIALALLAVGASAREITSEIRRQLREIPGLLAGKIEAKPEYDKCLEIASSFALKELKLPVVLAVITPIIVSKILGLEALIGLLLGALMSGLLLSLILSGAGISLSKANSDFEPNLTLGLNAEIVQNKAIVVGDLVGEALKEVTAPILNILIKLLPIIALLIAPSLI